jgi:cytochrome d ubiquinol oxidase subunit II
MITVFYALAAISLSAYVALDGFDIGAGVLHLIVAKNDRERRAVYAAIGPFWDGNEVWLLASGGVLFAVFPTVLAVAFSGFYLALFVVVWALILRALSIELRGHLASPLWRAFWDVVFCASSIGLAVLFGAALGNVLRGVPTGEDRWFTLPLFTTFWPTAPVGLLDIYTVTVGVFSLVALAHHGALFLAWKTDGEVNARARRCAAILFPCVSALLFVVFGTTQALLRLAPAARALPFVLLALAALGATYAFRGKSRELPAFIASAIFLVFALAAVAATLFPIMLRSIDGAHDITAYDAASKPYALSSVLIWIPLALFLVAFYFINLFRIYRGKVAVPANEEH